MKSKARRQAFVHWLNRNYKDPVNLPFDVSDMWAAYQQGFNTNRPNHLKEKKSV